jgi:hypothetical protein
MASGILGQSNPTATTNTTVYTVPAATATPGNGEWLEYDASIPANGVLERTGIVAEATKQVVAYVSAATASVNVYGYEA